VKIGRDAPHLHRECERGVDSGIMISRMGSILTPSGALGHEVSQRGDSRWRCICSYWYAMRGLATLEAISTRCDELERRVVTGRVSRIRNRRLVGSVLTHHCDYFLQRMRLNELQMGFQKTVSSNRIPSDGEDTYWHKRGLSAHAHTSWQLEPC
jgi:hypothetical protein